MEYVKAVEGEDTILLEIEKKGKDGKARWTFRNTDTKEEKEESESIIPKTFELQDIFKADLRTLLKESHS